MSLDTDDLLSLSRLYSYTALGIGGVMTATALVLLFTADHVQTLTLILVSLPCLLLGLCFSQLRKVVVVVRRLENRLDEAEIHPDRS